MKNIFFCRYILGLGGTTTFLTELIKKYYKTKDITLYYVNGDQSRILELKKYIRCVKWNGEIVECDNLFVNYDHEGFENFKAKHYYQIIHAQYKTNKIYPKVNDLFEKYICVSEIVKKEYQELTGLPDDKFIVSPNPIFISEKEKKSPLIIGSFTRLSWEKGKNRIESLIKALDSYEVNYKWFIYADGSLSVTSKNVIYKSPEQNIRNVISMCDIVAQLSDCEGDCYTIKEAKCIIDKVLITPCPSFFEMGCSKDKDIILNYDLSNIHEVVEKLIELGKQKPAKLSNFKPKEDKYNELLLDGKSNYGGIKMVKIKTVVDYYDKEKKKTFIVGDINEVDIERAKVICNAGLAQMINEEIQEIVEEPIQTESIEETKPEEEKVVDKKQTKKGRKKAK